MAASRDEEKPKLEWMYKAGSDLLNREEYLLGRTIDKNFEQLDDQEKIEHKEKLFGVQIPKNHVEYECIPFSIREYKNLQNSEQVDLQRKLMEDPLMAIKQKEMETRRKILENPVKLKEIHKILKTEKSNLLSSESNNKKSKKKKRKYSSSSSSTSSSENDSDSDDDQDLDKLLAKKYKKVKHSLDDAIKKDVELDSLLSKLNKKKKKIKNSKRSCDSSSSAEYNTSSDPDIKRLHKHNTKERQKYNTNSNKNRRDEERRKYKNYSNDYNARSVDYNTKSYKKFNIQKNDRYPEIDKHKIDNYRRNYNHSYQRNSDKRVYDRQQKNKSSSSEEESNKYRKFQETEQIKSYNYETTDRMSKSITQSNKSDSLVKNRTTSRYQNNEKPSKPTKLTEEEKEKRLKEMMENAVKRDEERTNKVNKYRKDCEDEEHAQRNRQFDDHFAKKELKKAFSSNNTVESRIKSKINYIQRSSHAMDSNFAKK